MDAFLSADTQRTLQALGALPSAKAAGGLLIGHKRGGRFFVESAFPAPHGFRPDPENMLVLEEIFRGKIIGFFVFGTGAAVGRVFLQPLACGRMLLEIARPKSGKDRHRAFYIDYDGRFRQVPIGLHLDAPEKGRPRRAR